MTPPLTPVSVTPLEKVPVAMPANMLSERLPPRARSARFSTLPAATDKMVISRNVLLGLCLTTFAFGIVTTLVIDHLHARASEAPAPRESEPVVLQTTPIEPVANPAPAAEAVIVQLPPVAEKATDRSAQRSSGKALPHPAPPAAPRVARPIATASHKRTSGKVQSNSSSAGTEAAPDHNAAIPASTTRKWVDPFDQ